MVQILYITHEASKRTCDGAGECQVRGSGEGREERGQGKASVREDGRGCRGGRGDKATNQTDVPIVFLPRAAGSLIERGSLTLSLTGARYLPL